MCSTDRTELPLADNAHACTCGTGAAESHHAAESAVTTEVLVEGMTCSHCVSSVTEELSSVDGVDSVDVDLKVGGSSVVRIGSSAPLDADAVRSAVEEAGYRLAVPVA